MNKPGRKISKGGSKKEFRTGTTQRVGVRKTKKASDAGSHNPWGGPIKT